MSDFVYTYISTSRNYLMPGWYVLFKSDLDNDTITEIRSWCEQNFYNQYSATSMFIRITDPDDLFLFKLAWENATNM